MHGGVPSIRDTWPKKCTDANGETAALGCKVARSMAHGQRPCKYTREIEKGMSSRKSTASGWLGVELQPGCNPMSLVWTWVGIKQCALVFEG
jgi:hypothetical protein